MEATQPVQPSHPNGSLRPSDFLRTPAPAPAATVRARKHGDENTLEILDPDESESRKSYVIQMETALQAANSRASQMEKHIDKLQRELVQRQAATLYPQMPPAPRVVPSDLKFIARLAVGCIGFGVVLCAGVVALTAWAMKLQ